MITQMKNTLKNKIVKVLLNVKAVQKKKTF